MKIFGWRGRTATALAATVLTAGGLSAAAAGAPAAAAPQDGTGTTATAGPTLDRPVAYVRDGNVYVKRGARERRLTSGRGHARPRWSPDGARIAYLRSGLLWTMNADGSGKRQLTARPAAGPAWSPDGRWIAFQRPYGELYLVRPDGSDLHRVPVELPSGAGARQPEWSPDGEWIVFALERGGSSDIFAVRPDGTDLTEVTGSPGADDTSPDWAP